MKDRLWIWTCGLLTGAELEKLFGRVDYVRKVRESQSIHEILFFFVLMIVVSTYYVFPKKERL